MAKKINVQWKRVISTPITEAEKAKQDKNRGRMLDPKFKEMCEAVGVAVTKRQASKFNNGKGLAYRYSRNLVTA